MTKELGVDGLRRRRRVDSELVGDEPATALVHQKRLGNIAVGRERSHPQLIRALTERFEAGELTRRLDRERIFAVPVIHRASAFQRTKQDRAESVLSRHGPRTRIAGEKWSPRD